MLIVVGSQREDVEKGLCLGGAGRTRRWSGIPDIFLCRGFRAPLEKMW
jgi:hypothetical protein